MHATSLQHTYNIRTTYIQHAYKVTYNIQKYQVTIKFFGKPAMQICCSEQQSRV